MNPQSNTNPGSQGASKTPNPAASYQSGADAAKATLGISKTTAPPPNAFNPGGVAASAQKSPFTPVQQRTPPPIPAGPSAFVPKMAGFALSHRPEERALESHQGDDKVHQPRTNEDNGRATGVDAAFQYLNTPSESDPYTIPRMY